MSMLATHKGSYCGLSVGLVNLCGFGFVLVGVLNYKHMYERTQVVSY